MHFGVCQASFVSSRCSILDHYDLFSGIKLRIKSLYFILFNIT